MVGKKFALVSVFFLLLAVTVVHAQEQTSTAFQTATSILFGLGSDLVSAFTNIAYLPFLVRLALLVFMLSLGGIFKKLASEVEL